MTRYAIGIEYSGAAYCGWQRQPHCVSVQQWLEEALGFVANHELDLVCAGRTDTGVHATQQVAHFDSDSPRSDRAWLMGANCRLPRDIRIKWVVPVAEAFLIVAAAGRAIFIRGGSRSVWLLGTIPVLAGQTSSADRPAGCA